MLFSKYDEVRADHGLWICEQVEDAQTCSKFSCVHAKKALKKAFEEEVLDNPDKMRESYKDLYILSWLIAEDEGPWYKRLWNKLFRSSNVKQLALPKDEEKTNEASSSIDPDYDVDPGTR